MKLNEYRDALAFTRDPDGPSVINAALGLAGESGEVAELVKKEMFQGRPYALEDMLNELGDVLWYLDLAAEANGYTLEDVAKASVTKLRKRYPNGWALGGGVR